MKIEPISLQPTTYHSEDGKQSIVMNANLTLDGLAVKINEIIRHTNGLYASIEALSHSIPPKGPTSPTPEEMGYIKLDEDSLRKFNGQEDSTVKHFRVAIESIKAIAFHNAASPDDSLRLDPQSVARGKFGNTIGVRQLAQRALDELTEALNTIHITQGGLK